MRAGTGFKNDAVAIESDSMLIHDAHSLPAQIENQDEGSAKK